MTKTSRISVSKKSTPARARSASTKPAKRLDLEDLNTSFTQIQQTRMTKVAAENRKAAKLVSVKPKISVPNRETVHKTTDDLANLLKDF